MKAYVSSGGGVRVGGTFGAYHQGEKMGKITASQFDYFAGTSAGALDAAMTANGWTGRQKVRLFIETPFHKFFTPWPIPFQWRKYAITHFPISLKRFAKFIDGLGFQPVPNLYINTVDSVDNKHVIYCEKLPDFVDIRQDKRGYFTSADGFVRWFPHAFSQLGYGKVLTRSMALPGLKTDDPRFKDGGLAEKSLLSIFPHDAHITLFNLGYAGNIPKKKGPVPIIEELLYAYEFKAYTLTKHLSTHFDNLRQVFPAIYDIDSTNFDLNKAEKANMVHRAMMNTKDFWSLQ